MTHTPETQKAAEEYAAKLLLGPKAVEHFLAGYDYRQKEIDELVEALKKGKLMMENIIEFSESSQPEQGLNLYNQLIQKHKR